MAENASQLTTALASGKDTIAVTESFSTANAISLGSKKLVGPKYFAYVEGCKSAATPTLTYASGATVSLSSGEINQLNLSFLTVDSKVDGAVSGSGTIKDSIITTKEVKSTLKVTGKITLAGNVTLDSLQKQSSNYAIQAVLRTDRSAAAQIEVTGKTTLKGYANIGLELGTGSQITIASSGSLVFDLPDLFMGIDFDNDTTFTANGPVKFEKPASSAVGYVGGDRVRLSLNAAGNYIKTTYTGFMTQADGSLNINGSTTIECFRSSTSGSCTGIDSRRTNVNIAAPVTLLNFTKIHDSQYPTIYGDEILSMVGGTLKLTSTIESKSNVGKLLINGNSMNMSSSSAILGATYIYGDGKNFTAAAGAKLKLGGVCRKAASSGTLSSVTYDKAITSPVSPFTSGC